MPEAPGEKLRWAALAACALVPRLAGALLRRPWHDEYFTAWAARLPLGDLLAALRLDSGPPLPYVLAKLIAGLGVEPLAAARAVSVAAGTAAVLLAARAARGAFGARAGWWTGALLAFHPLAVAWSCEGRAYALELLAAAWAWDRIQSLARGGPGAAGLALAVSLGCWSHGLGMILALALAAVALTLAQPARGRALGGVGAGLASHLPWLPVASHQPSAAVAWMAAAWQSTPLVERLVAPVRFLSPAAAFASAVDLPSSPAMAEALAAVVLAALVVTGCGTRAAARLALGVALPTAGLGVLAFLWIPAFYPGRGEVLAMVPLFILAGTAAGSRRAGALAGAALVCAGVVTVARAERAWARSPAREEQRIADAIRRSMPQGGVVIVGGYWRLGLGYHLEGPQRFDLVSYPFEAGLHPGWYDTATDRPDPSDLAVIGRRLDASRSPVAVVASPGFATARDLEQLAASLGLRRATPSAGAVLFLPDLPPGPG